MNLVELSPTSGDYPAALRDRLGTKRLPRVAVLGNREHLNLPLLGFFCSAKCPGNRFPRFRTRAGGRLCFEHLDFEF